MLPVIDLVRALLDFGIESTSQVNNFDSLIIRLSSLVLALYPFIFADEDGHYCDQWDIYQWTYRLCGFSITYSYFFVNIQFLKAAITDVQQRMAIAMAIGRLIRIESMQVSDYKGYKDLPRLDLGGTSTNAFSW